jgi:hypothetical protein
MPLQKSAKDFFSKAYEGDSKTNKDINLPMILISGAKESAFN